MSESQMVTKQNILHPVVAKDQLVFWKCDPKMFADNSQPINQDKIPLIVFRSFLLFLQSEID